MTVKNRHQSGDTIVEILIAIAVVSLLLTAAFVLTRSNLRSIQNSQERSQAQALVGGQLERLKSIVADEGAPVKPTTMTAPFCIDTHNTIITDVDHHCNLASDGTEYTPASPGFPYSVRITYDAGVDGKKSTFTVVATWDSATTSGQSKVSMVYRLYDSGS